MEQLCASLANNDAAYTTFFLAELPLVTKMVAYQLGTALLNNTTVQRMDIPLDHLSQDLDDESIAGIVQFLATSSCLVTVRLTNSRRPMDDDFAIAEQFVQALVRNRAALVHVGLNGFTMPAALLADLISSNQVQDVEFRTMRFVGDEKPLQDAVYRNRSLKRISLDGSVGEDMKRNAGLAAAVLKGLTGNAASVVQTIAISNAMARRVCTSVG